MACMPSGADLGDALVSAAGVGVVMTVRQLLAADADVNFQDESTSALSIASEKGHEKVLRLLLEKGAQVNAKTKRGGATIHEAAFEGHTLVVRLLVESGADIQACTDTGATALDIAEEMGHFQIVRMLLGNMALTPSKEQLTIGIDFDTDFSSVAYHFEAQGRPDSELVMSWPGAAGILTPNTPTLIDYDVKQRCSFTWGYKVNPTGKGKLEGFKLLLDPDQPVPLYVPAINTKKELSRLGKDPVSVASDYIGALYKHALDSITSCYPKDFVNEHQKKFVFTIPAVWTDKAKDNLKRAAKLAGIYAITLVEKPVAATLFALHHFREAAVTIGDAFIICHIGKDIVDLASFEYTKLGLGLKELGSGSGRFGISSIISRRFEEFIRNIVGDEQFLELKKTEGFKWAMKDFDREVKPSFVGDSSQTWKICFPMAGLEDDSTNNITGDCLHLTSEAVQQIFKPVINCIVQIVAEQVANVRIKRLHSKHPKGKEIKAIFLTEDFGRGIGPSLILALQKANPDIRVMKPPYPWAAVVKGAVLSQLPLEEQITSYIATKYYGVIAPETIYNELLDIEQPKFWDPYKCCFHVRKPVWFIEKGDNLSRDMRIEVPCRQRLPDNLIVEQEIFECSAVQANKWPEHGTMRLNCTLTMNLTTVPFHDLKEFGDFIEYKLIIKIRSQSLAYSVEIKGKEMGSVETLIN